MFDLSQISAYLVPSIVILCLIIGYIIKNLIPSESVNRYIPLIVGVVGVVAAIVTAGTTGVPITVDVIVGGLASGEASTGLFEAYKNLIKGNSNQESPAILNDDAEPSPRSDSEGGA